MSMLHTQGFYFACDVYFVHSMEPLAIKDAVAAASTRGTKTPAVGTLSFRELVRISSEGILLLLEKSYQIHL